MVAAALPIARGAADICRGEGANINPDRTKGWYTTPRHFRLPYNIGITCHVILISHSSASFGEAIKHKIYGIQGLFFQKLGFENA